MRVVLAMIIAGLINIAAVEAATAIRGAEITVLLSDVTLTGSKNGKVIQQIFQKGGLTLYLENGAQSVGTWKVEGDKYCSQWPPNESWSCYEVEVEGQNLTFIASNGTRYPMLLPHGK